MIENVKYESFVSEPEEEQGVSQEKHYQAIAREIFNRKNEIGEGNFSFVFSDDQTGACYKVLKPGATPRNNVRREAEFLTETRKFAYKVKIPTPIMSINTYLKDEYNKVSHHSALVMEKIQGPSLEDIIRGRVSMPESFVFEDYFLQLESFLENMHKEGIFHRDIAARNLMIEEVTGMPCVIDFGDAVYYSYQGVQEGEHDPYDQTIYDIQNLPVDQDISKLQAVKQEILKLLTNNK